MHHMVESMRNKVLNFKLKILFKEVFNTKELIRIIVHDSLHLKDSLVHLILCCFMLLLCYNDFLHFISDNLKELYIMKAFLKLLIEYSYMGTHLLYCSLSLIIGHLNLKET